MTISKLSHEDIKALDNADPLAALRDEFVLPPNTIYLNGNSLGPLARHAQQRAREVVDTQWGNDLIASWNKHAWIDLPQNTARKIAPLLGAQANQIICCDSVSINLIKALAACLKLQGTRRVILSQQDNFPTDLYAAQGLAKLLEENRCELQTVLAEDMPAALSEQVAVLFLTEVNFRNGARHDIQKLTALAKAKGILVVWDLSHSVGVLPLHLDEWGVDFAVGCGYKYLNGGPGAPAFIYAAARHHKALEQPLQGWMGHREPFAFTAEYEKAQGMAQFLVGTPPIVSLAILDSALDLFQGLSIETIHRKSESLSEVFLKILKSHDSLQSLTLESPEESSQRGAQLAFSHAHAYSICRALNEAGVIVDFRSPDIIRFGFSPLFLRYEDIWLAVQSLQKIIVEESFKADRFSQQLKVT